MYEPDSQFLDDEFNQICEEIRIRAAKIKSPSERIRLVSWLKKLRLCESQAYPDPCLRLEYGRLLLVCLEGEEGLICFPFNELPPEKDLKPLPEIICEKMKSENMINTEVGPLHPVLMHKSDDGRATVSVKKTPDGTLLCYMAVSREQD